MFNMKSDLGASLFQAWSETEKRAEVQKLVEGYRAGVPVGILCSMAEAIAGSRVRAISYLAEFMTAEERRQAIERADGGMRALVEEFFSVPRGRKKKK